MANPPGDNHAPAPPAPAPAPKPPKKTLGERLGGALLAVLFIVLFLIGLNALLGIFWPSLTDTIVITGNGFQNSGTALMHTNIQTGIFTQGWLGFMFRMLVIVGGSVGVLLILALFGMFVAKVVKKKRAEAGL